ncbi:FmdB family zinc ribbon protein [Desulfolutivibrio sulfoxidireducens]|uniref:FmdB family zinc ribbon protein n=1 Tax=Desulfolutivibrio sulfoxidireducens TaxID=2773299 RepID=UPI00159EB2B3|nr:zinc ribbon domain-containing protein [Desulfolutivibrio sulfoxidireducens]QLA15376.1 zinc ribbon domain-containing protein [Desulfolutivibrio sulfoxidireducens]QLA18973.1 zinc ribbon domain-containing protein [Desulfolutivibrio sulfoxidireducens]
MPLYEYVCQDCQVTFEVLAPMGETVAECPNCRSADTRRCPSMTHFRHADHWQKDMMGALGRSQERDQQKRESKRA